MHFYIGVQGVIEENWATNLLHFILWDLEQDLNHFSKFAKITGSKIGWMIMV
jgi:hypothetical protein